MCVSQLSKNISPTCTSIYVCISVVVGGGDFYLILVTWCTYERALYRALSTGNDFIRLQSSPMVNGRGLCPPPSSPVTASIQWWREVVVKNGLGMCRNTVPLLLFV